MKNKKVFDVIKVASILLGIGAGLLGAVGELPELKDAVDEMKSENSEEEA